MQQLLHVPGISIHAPSRERRPSVLVTPGDFINFNPRSLAGATKTALAIIEGVVEFQSTLPRGSDVTEYAVHKVFDKISIHAPSRERPYYHESCTYRLYFNPRSLAGATDSGYLVPIFVDISIHAPSRERPVSTLAGHWSAKQFQSTLPRGSDCWFSQVR